MEIFALRDFSFTYPGQTRRAVDGLSLTVNAGDFLVLCGPSGCGKTTLLRQLKTVLAPHGRRSGEILFEGEPLDAVSQERQAARIGFVQQSPENQIVADKVWHELAFGLESLGLDTPTIRRRVAEMASFFGIQTWFQRDVSELSGGQKQLLNLASVMAMQPSVLVLDEPTSQLDPIAASDFLSMLGRINRELGTTVLLTEHRLEDALPLATRAVVMEQGRVLFSGTPAGVGESLRVAGHGMFLAMPAAMRIWAGIGGGGDCPITVREGRDFLESYARTHPVGPLPPEVRFGAETSPAGPPERAAAVSAEASDGPASADAVSDGPSSTDGSAVSGVSSAPSRGPEGESPAPEAVLAAENVWFAYDKNLPDAVRGLNLTVRRGEFLALLGGNGVGKSTALKLLAGVLKPYRGEIRRGGRTVLLPQNPQALFARRTVREDLLETASGACPDGDPGAQVLRAAALCRLEGLLDRHPYDLSGGEQQRAALAKVLLTGPDVLLLDEPTKGLDAEFKRQFAGILRSLLRRGTTVVMVSHDLEFCASYAGRCALFFDGSVAACGSPRSFFSGNSFYTTSANRMARFLLPRAVTPEEVIGACGGEVPPGPEETGVDLPGAGGGAVLPAPDAEVPREKRPKLPLWRRIAACAAGLTSAGTLLAASGMVDLRSLGLTEGLLADKVWLSVLLILSLTLLAASLRRRKPVSEAVPEGDGGASRKPRAEAASSGASAGPAASSGGGTASSGRSRVSRRTALASVLILLAVPLTLTVGVLIPGSGSYYPVSFLVLLECMLPFFLRFEGRRPQARELVVIAVICAIGVAGRAAFFMLPQFKPVMALTILAGVAFGGESGFLVGALTMLTSNMLFSQGPWTPWQMFCMGIIGFLAGILFRRGRLRPRTGALCVYGALSAVLIYGGVMNPVSALLAVGGDALSLETLIPFWVSGFPLDCVHGAATVLFLYFGAEPMLWILGRVRRKYGLADN